MYDCRRAADVTSLSEGRLWRMDRASFKHVLCEASMRHNSELSEFLKTVEIFRDVSDAERTRLAACVKRLQFSPGDVIIKQFEEASSLFIIREGKVALMRTQADGVDVEMMQLGRGALLAPECRDTLEARGNNVRLLHHDDIHAVDFPALGESAHLLVLLCTEHPRPRYP